MSHKLRVITFCVLVFFVGTISALAQSDGNNIVIQPNEVGVVFDQVNGDLLAPIGPGTHEIDAARYTVTIYSTLQQSPSQTDTFPVEVRTRDGQSVNISADVFYQIAPQQVNNIHTNWGTEYDQMLIRPLLRGLIREVASTFDAEQLYGQDRALFTETAEAVLTEALEEEHFILSNFLLTDVQFSDAYTEALENRAIAENAREIAEIEQRRLIIEAEGRAQAAILAAQAQAEAMQILADQQLRYLQQLAPLIEANPELLNYEIARLYSQSGNLIVVPAGSDISVDPETTQSGEDGQ